MHTCNTRTARFRNSEYTFWIAGSEITYGFFISIPFCNSWTEIAFDSFEFDSGGASFLVAHGNSLPLIQAVPCTILDIRVIHLTMQFYKFGSP